MVEAQFEGGLADPSRDSQKIFRALLSAMAEPGTVMTLPAFAAAPAPFGAAMAAVALTLCDIDTPVFLDEPFRGTAARWLAFHTDAPLTDDRAEARFAFLTDFDPEGFSIGTDVYPDRSATLVVERTLAGTAFSLKGPGIEGTRDFSAGLDAGFAAKWAENRTLFPCGVDLVLTDGARLAALPRTTEVTCTSQ